MTTEERASVKLLADFVLSGEFALSWKTQSDIEETMMALAAAVSELVQAIKRLEDDGKDEAGAKGPGMVRPV